MSKLFTTAQIGGLVLPNRLVMAPLTRTRAEADGSPTDLMAEYYAQRASAGLIIAEASTPNLVGRTYPNTPGIHTPRQIEGWRRVTGAVAGRMFLQLQHGGRVGHPDNSGLDPVAPSPIALPDTMHTPSGHAESVVPREMTGEDIATTIADFAQAARNAVAAGFDGVEVHSANGYLLHQFISPNTNRRTDEWGGPVENRVRLTVEVVRAVVAAIGADRVGVRLSPGVAVNGVDEGGDTAAIYAALVPALREIGPAYLHVVYADPTGEVFTAIRRDWPGVLIANPNLGAELPADGGKAAGEGLLDAGADLVALGRAFIANPDLVERLQDGTPLNPLRGGLMYTGGAEGYTDYPTAATLTLA